MKTRILSQQNVKTLLTMDQTVRTVEQVFAAHGRGEALMPHKIYLTLQKYQGDFRAMPAYLNGSAGLKWVNSHPENPKRHHLPAVMALFILSDPSTAEPLAIMDATYITAARTGAAGAVASKYLAKKNARSIGFVGTGVQSRTLLQAHRVIYPAMEVLVSDVSSEAASAFAREVGGKVVSVEQACKCDIVCTSTPSRTPVVRAEWIAPGTHINAMGADAAGKQELATELLQRAAVYIDDWEQATESGEINVPLSAGHFTAEQVAGTLGEVIAGKKQGRTSDEQVTVFDSTGLAIQDLAVARTVYEAAKIRDVGLEFAFA